MPPHERARTLSLNFSGMYLGTIVALLLSPPIIAALGWPWLFYLSGAAGLIWVAAWMAGASDARKEKGAVAGDGADARITKVPWGAIARERAVWAIVLAHFCSNFGFNILLLWLPTYLHRAFGTPVARVGAYSLVPWMASFAVANAGGWIADSLIIRGVSVGRTRKVMQSAAFAMGALPLLALAWAGSPAEATALVALSAASSSLGLSAYGVNHLDIGPAHAGVLMGISNTIATIPGIVGVAAAGWIVQETGSFAAVFMMIAAVYGIGMAGYLAWASGERRI
jgi:ACS family sodium-dependent inorganic phosphate cotransporter